MKTFNIIIIINNNNNNNDNKTAKPATNLGKQFGLLQSQDMSVTG